MKHIIICLILIVLAAYAFAASPVVTNVIATPSARMVSISYDLTADAACTVTLLVSANNGSSYNDTPLTAVSGAVGNNVSSGTAKEIIWHPAGDGMATGANYKVKVIARDNPSPTTKDDFILVQGGTFNNGTSDVTLSSFYMDKYELTQGEYQAVMGINPGIGFGVGSNYPEYYVSWFNAVEYCNRRSIQEGLTPCYSYSSYGTDPSTWPAGWNSNDYNHNYVSCNWTATGYRLPTEMESMYAAKGGNQSHGYTYSGSNTIGNVAWYNSNSGNTTHSVGTKAANELGLYDLSGSVFEWVWDIDGSYPSGSQNNPTGPNSGSNLVVRGGSWGSGFSYCTVAFRGYAYATDNYPDLGFRCVRHVPTVTTPTFNPAAGTYTSVQSVTISSSTPGASIRYTTDGSDPSETVGTLFSAPVELSSSQALKAIAYLAGYNNSLVASAEYVLNLVPEGFVMVPGGTFTMGRTTGTGDSNEIPTHSVTLNSFYMAKYEVTQGEYQAIKGSNPSQYGIGTNYPVNMVNWYSIIIYCNLKSIADGLTPVYTISGSTNPSTWGTEPTSNNATWNAVICNWSANGYRLPTEAEWEYAARGATNTPDYLYSGSDDINAVAWYTVNNSPFGSKPVGTKAPNSLGLYDMSGNVWEMCWDLYGNYTSISQDNPTGASSGTYRVGRSGGWSSSSTSCRVASRSYGDPIGSGNSIGFRISRSGL